MASMLQAFIKNQLLTVVCSNRYDVMWLITYFKADQYYTACLWEGPNLNGLGLYEDAVAMMPFIIRIEDYGLLWIIPINIVVIMIVPVVIVITAATLRTSVLLKLIHLYLSFSRKVTNTLISLSYSHINFWYWITAESNSCWQLWDILGFSTEKPEWFEPWCVFMWKRKCKKEEGQYTPEQKQKAP